MSNTNSPLQSGNSIRPGLSPRKNVAQNKCDSTPLFAEIAAQTIASSIKEVADSQHLSESSVVKICISRAKRDQLNLMQLIPQARFKLLQEFIFEMHTTSVKKLVMAAQGQFTEGEIRLVRYLIQQQDTTSWDF